MMLYSQKIQIQGADSHYTLKDW